MLVKAEPAVLAAAFAAVLNVLVLLVFGRELEKEEEAAIVTVITIVAGFFIRSKVTPVG